MTYHPIIIVDSGILVAYYSVKDRYHQQVRVFFERCTSNLVTTVSCATEVMWLIGLVWRSHNEFLRDLAIELYECIQLLPEDFSRIAELNERYADLPGDFADLSLIAISERVFIPEE